MNVAIPMKSVETNHSEQVDIEGSIREKVHRDSAAFRESHHDGELVADNLGALMGRVSESSAREIDRLIDELMELREKLRTDANRVQRDITAYAALSQSVMQLTKIIADGVTHVKEPDGTTPLQPDHKVRLGAAARDL